MHNNAHNSNKNSTAYYYAMDGHAYGPHSLGELRGLLSSGSIDANVLVAASGDAKWVPLQSLLALFLDSAAVPARKQALQAAAPPKGLFSFLDCISGLPPAKSLPWKEIFKKSFAVNSEADAEAVLLSGYSGQSVPWVFSRILVGGLLSMVILLWALETFSNLKLIPGFFFVGCVTVPVATLVFLMELCSASQLNGYRVAKAVVVGGLLSIVFTLVLNDLPLVSRLTFTPMLAGPVEETAKLAAAMFIARNWTRARRVQDGLVLGAAVGAGFAMIETAGYIFESFLLIHDSGVALDWYGAIGTLSLRAIMSPFAHVLWSAVVVGSLWYSSRGSNNQLKGLFSHVFLRIFIFIVGLHAIWNSPFLLPFADSFSATFGKFALIGASGWYVLLQLNNVDSHDSQEGDQL
ncbi:PrsW family glutamic-type intramembrane protease [Coraliomargarita sp. W4R72]